MRKARLSHSEVAMAAKTQEISPRIRIGCAGWSIPRPFAGAFPLAGTHLERYAHTFSAVEINSSFYRHHKPETYRRWAGIVPYDFRFAVKMPRHVSHELRLVGTEATLDRFFAEVGELGAKLGPVLLQLPPSFAYDEALADRFFDALRDRYFGALVFEPRHPSWFGPRCDALLASHRIARAAADPAVVPDAARPAGDAALTYFRLHGSPQMYYSPYSDVDLDALSRRLRGHAGSAAETWCIFDNTTVGYATENALYVLRSLGSVAAPAAAPWSH
jgi:uncharacterized protein YecE (DUF72 family)